MSIVKLIVNRMKYSADQQLRNDCRSLPSPEIRASPYAFTPDAIFSTKPKCVFHRKAPQIKRFFSQSFLRNTSPHCQNVHSVSLCFFFLFYPSSFFPSTRLLLSFSSLHSLIRSVHNRFLFSFANERSERLFSLSLCLSPSSFSFPYAFIRVFALCRMQARTHVRKHEMSGGGKERTAMRGGEREENTHAYVFRRASEEEKGATLT